MGRRKAREGLMSLVFANEFFPYIDEDVKIFVDNFEYNEKQRSFIVENYTKLRDDIEKIDSYIIKHLKNWTIDRLYKVDRSILRVAVYELIIEQSTPKEIVANEAVNMAKKFGSEDSSRLINGIIGTIIRSEKL